MSYVLVVAYITETFELICYKSMVYTVIIFWSLYIFYLFLETFKLIYYIFKLYF